MKTPSFSSATFLGATLNPQDFTNMPTLPEIFLIGRSNVGKSSLINHLCNTKIAKTSATPGKTQTFNFYSIDDLLLMIDLPGYGYAEVPFSLQDQWAKLFEEYLQQKKQKRMVLWLLDIRHPPSKEDQSCLQFLLFHHIFFLIVFTKCDTLAQNKVQANVGHYLDLLKHAHPFEAPCVYYSIKDGKARVKLRKEIINNLFK